MKEEGIDLPCRIAMAVRTDKYLQQAIHYFEATWKANMTVWFPLKVQAQQTFLK